MTLPTTQPNNGTDDDSDMFGPPRSSPPIGYHHHRSKVPMISPKLRQREERKRILQLCAHKLERIKDSEANLRRSVCINNTYSRLTDELRREKQSRYLANLPKSDIKPEAAHNNTFSSYKCSSSTSTNTNNQNNLNSNINNNNSNSNLQHKNDPMEMYPSSTIQNYHNLHYQQQQYQQSSMSSSPSAMCITTSVHSTAKPTVPCITNNNNNTNSNNNNFSNNNSNNNSTSNSISCQFYSNNNNSTSSNSSSASTSAATPRDCAISSYSQTSTISTSTTTFTCHDSTKSTIRKDDSTKLATAASTSPLNSIETGTSNRHKYHSSCHSTNSVDADLEILDRELSAIDATMPLTDPEITQGAEHLEKAVSSRKRLRSEDDTDRFIRDSLSPFYLHATATSTAQKLISSVIDDCPLDLKRQKLSSATSSLLSISQSSPLSMMGGLGLNSFNYGIGIGLGFGVSNSIVSNSYTIGCCSQVVASSLMSAATSGSTILSNNCINNNNNSLITNDLDLELALDLNPPNQKEFEVIMDALRLGTPSPTPSCASDSCGQAAMMTETGCNPGGIFNNLVVTSLET